MHDASIVIGIGNNSAISTSNIMKITAISRIVMRTVVVGRCFCVELAFEWGSFFSTPLIFFEISVARSIRAVDNMMATIAVVIIIIIIIIIIKYLVFTNFLIGSQVYFSCIRQKLFYLPDQ